MSETFKDYIKYFAFFIILAGAAFGSIQLLKFTLKTEYPIMVVVSQSMVPTLNVGDFIMIGSVEDFDNVVAAPQPEGDILVFSREGRPESYIVHRAIDKYREQEEWYFTTKGDNNGGPDGQPAIQHNTLGKVVGSLPILGYFPLFIKTSRGFFLVAALMFVIFFADNIVPNKVKKPAGGKFPWYVLLLFSAAPLVMLSFWFIQTNHVYLEIIALLFWYVGSLLVPLVFDDDDMGMMFWLYHFVLTVIPIGCDIVWWTRGITPSNWWFMTGSTMPITGLFQAETSAYLQFFNSFAFIIIPPVLAFLGLMAAKRRGYEPLLKLSRRLRKAPLEETPTIDDSLSP